MNRMLAAIAIVVALAGRTTAARIPVDVDGTIQSPEQVAFHRGDAVSVPYSLTKDSGKYSIALASNIVWDIAAYTNPAIVWQSVTGSIDNATNGWLTVSLASSNSIIPEGRYWGYVKALYPNGQQRVVVKQLVTVKYAPDDVDPAVSEIGYYARMSDLQSELFPYATKSWVEAHATTGSVDMVARDAAAWSSNALGGYLRLTNCNWIVAANCSAYEWRHGSNVVVKLSFDETAAPRFLSMAIATNPPSITWTFESAGESNRLETATVGEGYALEWSTWTNAIWSYSGGTGTVVALGVDLDTPTYARLVSLGGVSTSAYMLVSALFIGPSADEANRAVTRGELAAWDFVRARRAEVAEKVDAAQYVLVGGSATVETNGETGVVTTNWLTPGSLAEAWRFDAGSGTAHFRAIGLGGVVLSNWSGGTGSGFPLTNNGDLAGFALTNGSVVQATNGQFRTLSVSGGQTTLGALSAASAVLGPTTVTGDLTVYGTRTEDLTIIAQHRVDVYHGTNHIYTDEVHHRTNVTYVDTVVITGETRRVTNLVETYVNVGGSFTMSSGSVFNAEVADLVRFPGLTATTNGGVSVAITGRLDVSGAEIVGLPAQGVTNIGGGLTGDGLEAPLAVAWGAATTNDMTNVNWGALATTGEPLWEEASNSVMRVGDASWVGEGLSWAAGKLSTAAGPGGGGGVVVAIGVNPSNLLAGVTNVVANSSNTLFYLDLTAPTWIDISSDVTDSALWSSFLLAIRGTNELTITASGGSVTGFPERVWMRTNRTVRTIWDKAPGETVWQCDEL